MSAIVRIPTPLRAYTDGETDVPVNAATVGEALAQLTNQYPKLRHHLYTDDGTLRNFVSVYLNDEAVRHLGGNDAVVEDGDTITIVPSVAGGLEPLGVRLRSPAAAGPAPDRLCRESPAARRP
jgi:molybdopterin converting factor small subunit